MVLGVVLVLVGLAGFVMASPLLGLFEVNALHNVIHIVTGALLIWASMQGMGQMMLWGKILGVVYLVVAIVGFVMPDMFGLMTMNMMDNVLHLVLAAVFLYAGFMQKPGMGSAM